MFSSRTDKAHSQNGMSGSDYAWLRFLRRDADVKVYNRAVAKAEAREIILDELVPATGQDTRPGIGMMAKLQFDADVRECARLNAWLALEDERLSNLARIEAAFAWREVALSDCEHGCKLYERTNNGAVERQVQHSSVYGCRNTDGPIQRIERVEHYAPKAMPVRRYAQPRGFVARPASNRIANLDVEVPSLHHMAKARAKALGL